MKMEIWPDDVSMPEMTDWLAELRDDGPAESAGDNPDGQARTGEASPDATRRSGPTRAASVPRTPSL